MIYFLPFVKINYQTIKIKNLSVTQNDLLFTLTQMNQGQADKKYKKRRISVFH